MSAKNKRKFEETEEVSNYNLLLNSLQLQNSTEIEKLKKNIKKSKQEILPQISSSLSLEESSKPKKKIKDTFVMPQPIPGSFLKN
jgi:hypothetical protein